MMIKTETFSTNSIICENYSIYSYFLEREVRIDMYLPTDALIAETSLLLINDGQDLVSMDFINIIGNLYDNHLIKPILCVGIHCGVERKREYGTAYASDYKNRGDKAGLYSKFIMDELLPFIRKRYNAPSFKDKSFAGFSMGALSAFDIVWNNPTEFKKVGVFSGSLWWRRKGYNDGYDDENDRLMHLQIRKGSYFPWLEFFLQCGTLDETADRNNNGIIDSIDDSLDMIIALKAKGYSDNHIKYLQIENGKHDVPTWASAFPAFLKWGWGC